MAGLTQAEMDKIIVFEIIEPADYAISKGCILQYVRGRLEYIPRLFAVCGTDNTMEIEVDKTTDYGTIKITKKE